MLMWELGNASSQLDTLGFMMGKVILLFWTRTETKGNVFCLLTKRAGIEVTDSSLPFSIHSARSCK